MSPSSASKSNGSLENFTLTPASSISGEDK